MAKRYHDDFYYSFEILLGISLLWGISYLLHEQRFMSWSFIAFLGTLERDVRYRKILFTQRFHHTVIAGIISGIFLLLFGPGYTALALSLFFSMLVATLFTNYPAGWKVLPITSGLLNYLAIMFSQSPEKISLWLTLLRILETGFGAFLAVTLQNIFLRFRKNKA